MAEGREDAPYAPRRKTFDLQPPSDESSRAPSPVQDPNHLSAREQNGQSQSQTQETAPTRSRSILNLTTSTLFGIYSPSSLGDKNEPSTPWGTGAQTPSRPYDFESSPVSRRTSLEYEEKSPNLNWETSPAFRRAFLNPSDRRGSTVGPESNTVKTHRREPSHPYEPGPGSIILHLTLRLVILFVGGMAYGYVISLLHNNHTIAPVKVEQIDQYNWSYYVFWGIAGVGWGSLLPWVDVMFDDQKKEQTETDNDRRHARRESSPRLREHEKQTPQTSSRSTADWNSAVRSVGAFIGIAFAIRKLPWQSTLQVSLTLALVNPVLWYLIDRSKPGFLVSLIAGIGGTAILLGINPDLVPSPTTSSSSSSSYFAGASPPAGGDPRRSQIYNGSSLWPSTGLQEHVTAESIGVGTWIGSVLFCSCVCFGNIGRKLTLSAKEGRSWLSQ